MIDSFGMLESIISAATALLIFLAGVIMGRYL